MTTAQSGFLFDLNACTGCNACQLACSTENELGWGNSWRQVITLNPDRIPWLPRYHLSLACNHCAEAPCMKHCPALAIRRDEQTGAVLIDPDRCIGCGYCSWVCPYDAPIFDPDRQVMTKCTWCSHRLAEGRSPACVEQCPTGALGFGSLEGERVVAGFPDTAAQPAIRFQPLKRKPVETTWQPPQQALDAANASEAAQSGKVRLSSEWPLMAFTLLAATLVGWLLASLNSEIRVDPLTFLSMAALAAGASTLHLGQKQRAWRAVLNWRESWLSREVVTFSAFTVTSALTLFALPQVWAAQFACVLLGLIHLFCVDRVYDPIRPPIGKILHSADTLLTAMLLAALLRGDLLAYCLVGGVKLMLYVNQWLHCTGTWSPLPVLRLAAGILPAAILLQDSLSSLWLPLAAMAIGESIDRAQFYRQLTVISASQQASQAILSQSLRE